MKNFARTVALILVGALLVFPFLNFDDNRDFELSKNLDIYYSLFKELNNYYVDEIDPGKLIKTSIDEMLQTLDPYTNYIPESKMEDYKFMTTGQYGGIGAMISNVEGNIIISEIYKGFPAHKAELRVGDVIELVDGIETKGKNTDQISELLKGQPNTQIEVTIKRPGTDKPVIRTVTREKIKINSVPYSGFVDDKIGYISLSSFTATAGSEVKEAFKKLKADGAESIILDLRGNPGGLLNESVKITNLFVDKGELVVYTKGKFEKFDSQYGTSTEPIDKNIPLVILVNRSSASASEIVSGAIQDMDRGVVVGKRTFGKGLVQTTRELTYNTKLKVTTAKYYIPSGRCIQALDYSHRNEDGSVGKVPDSLITEFKTKNGRKVFDGGGVQPDIIVDDHSLDNFIIDLLKKNMIFDYVTEFCLTHESVSEPDKFVFDSVLYDEFVAFCKTKGYEYEFESQKSLKKLKKLLEKEENTDGTDAIIEELNNSIKSKAEEMFVKHRSMVSELIETEIASRFYYQEGAIIAQLKNDPQLERGIEILKNNELYSAILGGTEGEHKKN